MYDTICNINIDIIYMLYYGYDDNMLYHANA